jgi:hypothetical protein
MSLLGFAVTIGFMDGTAAMDFTLAQAADWVAVGLGAWVLVRAGAAKGVLRVKAPVRCVSCGRQKVWGRCLCTENRRRLR